MALCRAVLISQARGFAGVPSEGHFCSATAYASCNISSARSKSPSRPINVARIRPDSSRCSFSKSIRKEFPHRTLPEASFSASGRDGAPRDARSSFANSTPAWLVRGPPVAEPQSRSEEHTSELQSHLNLVCRLLLEKKKKP